MASKNHKVHWAVIIMKRIARKKGNPIQIIIEIVSD